MPCYKALEIELWASFSAACKAPQVEGRQAARLKPCPFKTVVRWLRPYPFETVVRRVKP
jgi:hypothetical protein